MGRIKNSLIKRTARAMLKEENRFTEKFDNNKLLLGNTMPGKRLRNGIAGYITRLKVNERKKAEMLKNQQ